MPRGGAHGYEAYALHLLGEIAAHSAPSELSEAGARYREALALAEELRMRPLVADKDSRRRSSIG